jgi:hypothetical protein
MKLNEMTIGNLSDVGVGGMQYKTKSKVFHDGPVVPMGREQG